MDEDYIKLVEMATRADTNASASLAALREHISSCARIQMATLGTLLVTLVGVIGTLLNLYVLPPRSVSSTTTETVITHPLGAKP